MTAIGINFAPIQKRPATLIYQTEGVGYIKLNELLTFQSQTSFTLNIGYNISIQGGGTAFLFLPNMELLQSGIQSDPVLIPTYLFPKSLSLFLKCPNYQTQILPGTILGTFTLLNYNDINVTNN